MRFQWIPSYSFASSWGSTSLPWMSVNEQAPFIVDATADSSVTQGELMKMALKGDKNTLASTISANSTVAVSSMSCAQSFAHGVLGLISQGAMSVFVTKKTSIPEVVTADKPEWLVTCAEGLKMATEAGFK